MKTSMFQISDALRAGLLTLSAKTGKSVNTLMIEACLYYLEVDPDEPPGLTIGALRHYTVRMPDDLKEQIRQKARSWQKKLAEPVTMNSVFNSALKLYLEKNLEGFTTEFRK